MSRSKLAGPSSPDVTIYRLTPMEQLIDTLDQLELALAYVEKAQRHVDVYKDKQAQKSLKFRWRQVKRLQRKIELLRKEAA